MWWKNVDASEPATHQFTWSGDEQAYGWMMRFIGHDTSDPINVYRKSGESGITPISPTVITTVDDAIILRLSAFDDSDITEDDPGLSGHTAITMDSSDSVATGQVLYKEFTEGKQSFSDTSVIINKPSGTNGGDLLIATVVTDGDTESSLSPPGGEGWTEIYLNDYSNDLTLGVWWKLADASEPLNYQFAWSGNQNAYGWIMRFTGHDQTTPIHKLASNGGSSSSPECPSVTTTIADCMIVRIGGFDDDDISVDSPGLSGHTVITMDESDFGSGTCSGGAGYKQQPASGDSGTSEFTLNASEECRTVTIAIAPATGGGGGGTVSGGAGFIKRSGSGSSGSSTFSLTASQESRALTIGIAPEPGSGGGSGSVLP